MALTLTLNLRHIDENDLLLYLKVNRIENEDILILNLNDNIFKYLIDHNITVNGQHLIYNLRYISDLSAKYLIDNIKNDNKHMEILFFLILKYKYNNEK